MKRATAGNGIGGTAVKAPGAVEESKLYYAIAESEHPYKPAGVTFLNVKFPETVQVQRNANKWVMTLFYFLLLSSPINA